MELAACATEVCPTQIIGHDEQDIGACRGALVFVRLSGQSSQQQCSQHNGAEVHEGVQKRSLFVEQDLAELCSRIGDLRLL